MTGQRFQQRGSVLVTVIWTLSLLAVYSVAVGQRASQELVFARWFKESTQTRVLAKAGIERALLELQSDEFLTFDHLGEKWGYNPEAFKEIPLGDGQFSVSCDDSRYGACDEAARINVNTASEAVFTNLFTLLKVDNDPREITKLVQAVLDWRDSDDAQMTEGAESVHYRSLKKPYVPRNGPMESVQELLTVRGMTREIYEALKPWVTVYTNGKVNINSAPAINLQALGLNPDLAEKVIDFRKGTDNMTGTKDDGVFQSIQAITQDLSIALSLSSEEFGQISNAVSADLLEVKSDIFRIRSIGRLIKDDKTFDTTILCVVKRNGTFLYWQEGES